MLGRLASTSADWAGVDEAVTASAKMAMGAENTLSVRDMEGVYQAAKRTPRLAQPAQACRTPLFPARSGGMPNRPRFCPGLGGPLSAPLQPVYTLAS